MIFFLSITGLLNGLGTLFIIFIVLIKGSKSIIHKIFIFLNLAIAIWALSYWRWLLADNHDTALFWARMLSIGSTLIPIFFLHWILLLVNMAKEKKLLLILGYIMTAVFLSFNFSPLFVRDVEKTFNFPYWPKPGILYHFYIIFAYVTLLSYGIFQLFKAYHTATGHKRAQMRYVFLGLAIAAPAGFSNFLLWYNINFPPYLNIFALAYMSCYAYAILMYRLMDIRFVLGRTAVYVFSFASIIALSFLLAFLNSQLANPFPYYFVIPTVALFCALLFRPIFRVFEKIASKYFYYTFYSYQQVLTDLGKRLTQFLDLGKLSSLITNTLINTMKLDRTVVLLREPETGDYQIQRNIGFKEENGISLVRDNFLTIWLERSKKPLVYEELSLIIRDTQNREEKEKLEKLKENMKRIEANICLPLFIEEKIIGMIILGNKISREPYSQQDIELLTALSSHSSIALYNARLYDQIQDLSQNLQKKVDEQTREIKEAYKKVEKAYEVEKLAHEELKKLDLAKTQFTKAATHHLRTPLTSIIGYLELILGGSYGKLENPEIKKKILATRKSANILQSLIEDILDITLLRTGKAILNLEAIQIEEVIEDIVKEEEPQTKNKGIYLKWEKPKTPLPKIMLDRKRIKEVIYNIVDNAIKYTEQGGVTINIKYEQVPRKREQKGTSSPQAGAKRNKFPASGSKNKDSNIKVIVRDTGVGLSEEEQRMFLQGEYFFERGKEAEKLWGPGRGIGLVIAYEFIRAHQGKLWVESRGRNKGSTFYVELPAK